MCGERLIKADLERNTDPANVEKRATKNGENILNSQTFDLRLFKW